MNLKANFHPIGMTPLPIVATVSRLVSKITDRIAGDRSEFPLLVACVAQEALKHYSIPTQIFYGQAAWCEVMEDQSVLWAGCWGDHSHFWLSTQHHEVVDLTVSVSHRKRDHQNPNHLPKWSPPMVWSKDVPNFYRYEPIGIAEIDLEDERDQRWFKACIEEFKEKAPPLSQLLGTSENELDFPEEAILCPGKKLLDDAAQSFLHYDRALMVQGIPESPF
jgi:hypothetical protein